MKSCFILIVIAAGLSGCISALPLSVKVVGAEVLEQTPEGARLEVALVVSNPNKVALPLQQASYSLNIEGVGGYTSIELPARVLGPRSAQTIRLPAAIATDGREMSGMAWRASGNIKYEPENYVRAFLTESGVPLPLALFSGRGVLE